MTSLDSFFARREEEGALEDESFKESGPFRIGGFDEGGPAAYDGLADFIAAAGAAARDPEAFFGSLADLSTVASTDSNMTFCSAFAAGGSNDVVHVDIVRAGAAVRRCVIIVPHWNAKNRAYDSMASVLRRLGFDVFIVTLPHHTSRAASSDQQVANDFLNADLGTAIRSVRQAVSDVRSLTTWLREQGYREVNLIGVSLGSCVASIVTAFDSQIHRSVLILTAGDFAETVWTGRATAHIKQTIERHIDLADLRRAWAIISPITFAERYRPMSGRLLIVSGRRDQVVQPYLTRNFVEVLREAQVKVLWDILPCGHYSIRMLPFAAFVVFRAGLFLRWRGGRRLRSLLDTKCDL